MYLVHYSIQTMRLTADVFFSFRKFLHSPSALPFLSIPVCCGVSSLVIDTLCKQAVGHNATVGCFCFDFTAKVK